MPIVILDKKLRLAIKTTSAVTDMI